MPESDETPDVPSVENDGKHICSSDASVVDVTVRCEERKRSALSH